MNANSCGKGLTIFSLAFILGTLVSVFSVNTQPAKKEEIKTVPKITGSNNPNSKGCEETPRDKLQRRINTEVENIKDLITSKASKSKILTQEKILDKLIADYSELMKLSRKQQENYPDNKNRAGFIDLFYRCEEF